MSRVGEAGFPAGNSLYPTSAGTAPTKPVGENQGGNTGFVEYKVNPLTGGVEIDTGDSLIVIADAAPDDNDGRPVGTLYFQRQP